MKNNRGKNDGALIRLNQVVKTYHGLAGDVVALKGIDLEIQAGEFVAITGKSGSGKTTLINMITGLDQPTSGEIWVAGTAVHNLRPEKAAKWRRQAVGVVFQTFELIPTLSVLHNVTLPMDFASRYPLRQQRRRALDLLEQVDIAEHAHKLPSQVSGGQQQRIAIARAMANDPPILAADEPTGSLDSATAEAVIDIFEELVKQGKTVVLVTHDQDIANRATRHLILAEGKLIPADRQAEADQPEKNQPVKRVINPFQRSAMLKSRWVKILNDLWGNKTRTMLIVLSIAVGLFAVGTIVSARTILSEGMAESFAAINPSSGTVRTAELFEEDFIQAVRGMRNVEDADARRALDVRIQVSPKAWKNLRIFAVPDYDDIRVNKIFPEPCPAKSRDSGEQCPELVEGTAWPPPEQEILIERMALPLLNAQVGDTVLIELPNEKQREMRIAGLAHDPAQLPAQIDGQPYGYISFETLKWLGEEYGFNELYVVAENQADKEFTRQVVNEVKSRAERNGLTIPMMTAAEPGQVPLDDILQAILFLMGTLGLLSLLLSMFLIVNTVSALLTQQKRQIGVMKAIGAQTRQIMGMYLGMVLIYGLIALVPAIPLSIVGARELSRLIAVYFNFDLANLSVPSEAILVQIGVGLLIPLLASLPPFIANLRLSAVEAMSVYTLGKGRFGTSFIDRLLSGTNLWFARRFLLRPVLLSLRNIFRNKVRLALTLITLTLGGATFIGVFSVKSALDRTLDDFMQLYNFDSALIFSRPYRIEKIKREAQAVPGVTAADVYFQLPARRVRPDGSESNEIFLIGFDVRSPLVLGPKIVQGRWLLPEDENAIVVDAMLMKEEPDIRLGDEIILKIEGWERPFRVVGTSLGLIIPLSYVNYPYISRALGDVGQTNAAIVGTRPHDEASVLETTAALEAHLESRGIQVNTIAAMSTERTEGEAVFAVIIFLLLVMALLLAIVGGLGLMGTMSINVLERTREIGILRTVGASNRGVARVFIREGIAIGLISWLFAAILAYPLGKGLSDTVGLSVMGAPLSYSYSLPGVWLWLVLVVILSALASLIPAQNAARLTVREVLAYE